MRRQKVRDAFLLNENCMLYKIYMWVVQPKRKFAIGELNLWFGWLFGKQYSFNFSKFQIKHIIWKQKDWTLQQCINQSNPSDMWFQLSHFTLNVDYLYFIHTEYILFAAQPANRLTLVPQIQCTPKWLPFSSILRGTLWLYMFMSHRQSSTVFNAWISAVVKNKIVFNVL